MQPLNFDVSPLSLDGSVYFWMVVSISLDNGWEKWKPKFRGCSCGAIAPKNKVLWQEIGCREILGKGRLMENFWRRSGFGVCVHGLTRRCNGLLVSISGVAEIIAAVELCR